ncbi:8655_t:CDS:1, partial [Paraglomus brasilianum]
MRESYLSYPVSEPEKTEDIPPPIQLDKSVGEYFKRIKLSLGLDMDDEKIKEKFINGLSPENQINAIRFGIKEPINKISEHLKFISTGPTDIQKFRFGELEQGNESVMEYFAKVEKC